MTEVEKALDIMSSAQRTKYVTKEELQKVQPKVQPRPLKTAQDYALAALSRSPVPLRITDIVTKMQNKGYTTTMDYPASYIQRVLRSSPACFQLDDGRWQVGRLGDEVILLADTSRLSGT